MPKLAFLGTQDFSSARFFPGKPCPLPVFPLCPPCEPIFFLSNLANLKVGVPRRALRVLCANLIFLIQLFSFVSSPCPLCSLCEPCFFDLWNERKPRYRAVAKRRSAYAAMPAQKPNTCQLESWRSQKDPPCSLCELDFLFLIQAFFLCVLSVPPVFSVRTLFF